MLLSVVVFGRNDNFKPASVPYRKRMRHFVDILNKELSGVRWELVLVEYNPPKNKPLLVDLSWWPKAPLKHVIVTHDDWDEFITKHEDVGARLSIKGKTVNFRKYPVFPTHAVYCGLNKSRGKYVFYTSTDNIFLGLSGIIKHMRENVVLRANIDRVDGNVVRSVNDIWRGSGDFIIIPRKKCMEFGGYLPIPHPKPLAADAQVVFFAMSVGCKVEKLKYRFSNVFIRSNDKQLSNLEYIVPGYDHYKWQKNEEFQRFKKHATRTKGYGFFRHVVKYNHNKVTSIFRKIMEG